MNKPLEIIRQFKRNWGRNLRAKQLGFKFGRTKDFKLPSKIQSGNKHFELSLPKTGHTLELFRDIILDDEYQLNSLPVDKIHNILDIGANIGLFDIAARVRFPNARIHAYEPNLDVKEYLNHQSATCDIEVMYEAVGKESCRGNIVKTQKFDSAARVQQSANGDVDIISFSMAIDRFGGEEIDLLKLDCEGYEHELLQDEASFKRCQYVTMEYHLGSDMKP